MIIFEVEYGAIETNKQWHFSTSAAKFVRSKKDYCQCGQCQPSLLPKTGLKAWQFFRKWDKFHLKNLTKKQYDEMRNDLEVLKEYYNFIEKGEDYPRHHIPFDEIKQLSMLPPKKRSRK